VFRCDRRRLRIGRVPVSEAPHLESNGAVVHVLRPVTQVAAVHLVPKLLGIYRDRALRHGARHEPPVAADELLPHLGLEMRAIAPGPTRGLRARACRT